MRYKRFPRLGAAMIIGATSAAADQAPPQATAEEVSALVADVQPCWNIDLGSAAGRIMITVAFDLDPEGRVVGDVRLLKAPPSNEVVVESAFQAARRAVLRCQGAGYESISSGGESRSVRLTFDPSGTRMR
ncbi:hypothetical protein [Pseudoroseicyclus aestuarii]|uniref:hypothetical protein n=1 Tax=Pseudoroseicyclus aestuarii TaxID=1795041 RepID=UPI0011B727D3|nr:hypothetical protein [Pseudoroseicyclus aestuarii]